MTLPCEKAAPSHLIDESVPSLSLATTSSIEALALLSITALSA